jgi:hypothetical protein
MKVLTGLSVCLLFATELQAKCVFLNRTCWRPDTAIIVPLGGNSWPTGTDTSGGKISNDGITEWASAQKKFNTYVRLGRPGNFKLWLRLKVADGKSTIGVTIAGLKRNVNVNGTNFQYYFIGEWLIKDTGYLKMQLSGIKRTGQTFADVTAVKLEGSAIDRRTNYVKNNDDNFFYWGRRGPSVHLGYLLADTIKAEWFYNEVRVEKGNDITGSYFMADGFGEGYFGMQVNSATERRILFSVWSPFKTDDPAKIPEAQKINLLKKGTNVHAGEFGSEGSGGQSFLIFHWNTDQTYRFLVHAKPVPGDRTEYTAYFYAPEKAKWMLIASFSRPQTKTYLKHLHSFLENFEPETGNESRQVLFTNAWIRTDEGTWIPLNTARFTGDHTAATGYRMDYAGGVTGNYFYLKNCGFFNRYTQRNIVLQRPATGRQPAINIDELP